MGCCFDPASEEHYIYDDIYGYSLGVLQGQGRTLEQLRSLGAWGAVGDLLGLSELKLTNVEPVWRGKGSYQFQFSTFI